VALVVQKYGGSSVANAERIDAVAERILAAHRAGHQLIVVVSAMGETTDHLLELAHQVHPSPPRRELDMLLTAGERISMALLAMALEKRGARAASFTGSQSGIITDRGHGRARIHEVKPFRLRACLDEGRIAIVAGFQGVSLDKEITTLGRGGSDTTAVAMAAAFDAPCEIFTDVDGVYTADPRRVPAARKIERMPYRAMATFARLGAQVLSARSVDLAARFRVKVRVLSSFNHEEGTEVDGHDTPMEGPHVTGIAHKSDVALVEIKGADTPPGAAAAALALLETAGVPLELLTLEANKVERVRLSWIAPDEDAARMTEKWDAMDKPTGRWVLNVHRGLALVSLVGHGLADDSAFALDAARRLNKGEVQVRGMRVGSLAISFVVPREAADTAVRALHAAYLEPAAVKS
jgi:aspartate kinase